MTKIVFRKKDHELFLMFWKKFEKKIDKLKNVVIENTDEEILLTYETQQGKGRAVENLIKFWLADSMVIYFKEKYIKSNLSVPQIKDLPLSLMVRALSIFDKATDVDCVFSQLKNMKKINVYSLYVFRFAEIRSRWQDICDLFIKNWGTLADSGVFMELMKYLLCVTESQEKEVNLYLENEILFITDKSKINLTEPIVVENDKDCVSAIFELISIAPQIIKVRFNKKLKPVLVGFLDNLFATKVSYCT